MVAVPGTTGVPVPELLRLARREGPRLVRGAALRGVQGPLLRADPGVHVRVRNGGSFTTERLVHLMAGVRVGVESPAGTPSARLHIGERTVVGDRTIINATTDLRIGSWCMIGWECALLDGDFHRIEELDGSASPISAPTTVEDRVWLGARVVVLKGVTIGAGTAVGAGSIVSRSLPPGVVAAGSPARPLRSIAAWR